MAERDTRFGGNLEKANIRQRRSFFEDIQNRLPNYRGSFD